MDNSILEIFNKFKLVLCMCPHCENITRLSELSLRSEEKAPNTWLDEYEFKISQIEQKEDKFSQEERKLREAARERGRSKVQKLVLNSMSQDIAQFNYDPYDIKAILHPIEFVVFNGMNNGKVDDVILLSRKTENPYLQTLHKGIENAVKSKSYDWTTIKVSNKGSVKFE